MQTLLKKVTTIILIATLFCACEKTIDFDSNVVKSKIVVNGILRPGLKIQAQIVGSRSQLSPENFFESLPEAQADLYVDGTFVETLTYVGKLDTFIEHLDYDVINKTPYNNGVYTGQTIAQIGKTYRLEISAKGYDAVSCKTTVPFPVKIMDADTSIHEKKEDDYTMSTQIKVAITFNDPPNINNYFRIQKASFAGNVYAYSYGQDSIIYSDTILTQYVQNEWVDISDPVFNESDNEANEIVMGAPLNNYAIFTDEMFRNNQYTLTLSEYSYQYLDLKYQDNFRINTIVLCTLSEEYYNYLNTANYHHWFEDDYFSEPVPVYSNVIGGMGIWCAESFDEYEYKTGEYPLAGKTYIDYSDFRNNNDGNYGYGYGYGSSPYGY
ncbi:DUF4249 domain-containing protein [uncultured Draconibacterium sp.]|uniref:DUF4249 domain-containing protein n=1 Tax=uncultured Draconibacterium sp. TaxID=1573823 RepID=UPI00321646B2